MTEDNHRPIGSLRHHTVDQIEPVWGVVAKMDADLDLAPATLDTIEQIDVLWLKRQSIA
jgi:hypothetical protein